ncbi:hypothetical protein LPTSP3_g04340 [Leptospira kobayashii]|uniref:Signal transduction histidine kinase internal region domain-containing protein n=1 Tax=Leptospira kobayashii TaxID=1917830 RepID=A0ABM7UFY6_9LEPT|nr:histidine kinase [Leptospira kobayashii]BDA77504.1 hypothetical protein LPTSP3_g04340 [Leptospira kobayashii]
MEKITDWLRSYLLDKPYLSIFAFFISLIGILLFIAQTYFHITLWFEHRIPKKTAHHYINITADSEYIPHDIELSGDSYDFKKIKNLNWKILKVWADTNDLQEIAQNPYIWMRFKAKNIDQVPDPYCLVEHVGANFQVFNDSGELLFQNGKMDFSEKLPSQLQGEFNWIKLNHTPTEYYYIRFIHREGFLFGFTAFDNRIDSQSSIYKDFAKINLLPIIFSSFFIVVGTLCALVYFIEYKKKYYKLIDLAVFSFLVGLTEITRNHFVRFILDNSEALLLISMIVPNFVFVSMHSGLRRLFGAGKWNLLNILIYLNLGMAVFNSILGLQIDRSPEVLQFFIQVRFFSIALTIINILGPIIVSYHAWRKGDELGLGHCISFIIVLFLVIIEIYITLSDDSSRIPVTYWGILIGVFAQGLSLEKSIFSNRQQIQEYKATLLKAEKSLKEAQLKTLQSKMSPHYLFNSLNTIHALHKTKPELIGDAILRLANNYRYFMDKTDRDLIPFEEEWEFTDDYLHLQKLRFYDTVRIEFRKEGDFKNVFLPPLVLQPIVENSFKHGFRTSAKSNWLIHVKANLTPEGKFQLLVYDNGAGLSKDVLSNPNQLWERSLGNIKERIEHLFPKTNFEIVQNFPSGVRVHLEIENIISENLAPVDL